MDKKRVILRADGSGKTGYGHFIRSLALASYLKDDFDCYFATYNSVNIWPTDYQFQEIGKVCEYLPIVGLTLDEANEDFLNELKKEDIVVLDNYYYSTEYQQKIKNIGCKLVCIDDMHDRQMVCDLLMTACPLKKTDFKMESYTQFVGGIEWAFLREPFLKPNLSRNIPNALHKIVIAMGGADPFHLTDKIVNCIHKVLPDVEIHVMAGDTVEISPKSCNIVKVHRKIEAQEVVKLFDLVDLGIFPASTVCMEAFSRKLPVVAGYYVDNQEEFYRYGVKNDLFAPLGCLLDEETEIEARLSNVIKNKMPMPVIIDYQNQKNKIIELFKGLEKQ